MQVQVTLVGGIEAMSGILATLATANERGITTTIKDPRDAVVTTTQGYSDEELKTKAPRVRRTKAQIEADEKAEKQTKVKSKPAAVEETEIEETEDIDDGIGEIDEDETPTKYTLEADIIPAFQAYAKKHNREKAGKVLIKFGVKSVRDLPTAKYHEVLETLRG